MDRVEKMDCRANGEVILTRATTEFQLKKGLNRMRAANFHSVNLLTVTALSLGCSSFFRKVWAIKKGHPGLTTAQMPLV
jgi:hypothetical protein